MYQTLTIIASFLLMKTHRSQDPGEAIKLFLSPSTTTAKPTHQSVWLDLKKFTNLTANLGLKSSYQLCVNGFLSLHNLLFLLHITFWLINIMRWVLWNFLRNSLNPEKCKKLPQTHMRKMVGFRYFCVIVWIPQYFIVLHREKRLRPSGNMKLWSFGVLKVEKTLLGGFLGGLRPNWFYDNILHVIYSNWWFHLCFM